MFTVYSRFRPAYIASPGLLNMSIGLKSHTLIVTNNIATLALTHSQTHLRGTTPRRVLHFSAFHFLCTGCSEGVGIATLSQPRAYKYTQSLHKSIRIYIGL